MFPFNNPYLNSKNHILLMKIVSSNNKTKMGKAKLEKKIK